MTGARALAAGALLAVLVGGVPLVLAATIGDPLPGWRDVIAGDVSDTALLAVLASITWAAWAQFAAAVIVEIVGVLIRVRIPRGIPWVMPGQQVLARALICAALVLPRVPGPVVGLSNAVGVASSFSTATPTVRAWTAANASTIADRSTAQTDPKSADNAFTVRTVRADALTTYWDLAKSYLGSGERWREIWTLNQGHHQDDGAVMTSPDLIRPGWVIRIPLPAREQGHTYVVQRGDTMSRIAQQWLGAADRWPQICELNQHHHQPGSIAVLRECDLIYPGWELRLPADARQPTASRNALPSAPQRPPSTRPSHRADPETAPTIPNWERAAPGPAMGQTPGRAAPTTVPSPSTRATSSKPPTKSSAPTHVRRPSVTGPSETSAPASASDQNGVHLPGSYIPWSLASALAAAIALVWLQRRRRHRPDSTGDDPTDLPPLLVEIDRHVARNPDLPSPASVVERASTVPALDPLPPGGLGLIGDGALPAARAAVTTMLASGGPRDHGHQAEVIIDSITWRSLVGTAPSILVPWPRLHTVATLDDALTLVETFVLHRTRIRDEELVSDPTVHRDDRPDVSLPSILLVTTAPTSETARLRNALELGADLNITALLLGAWTSGATLSVDADGYTAGHESHPSDVAVDRLAVLDVESAVAILATLREAHTGQRPCLVESSSAPASIANAPVVESSDAGTPDPTAETSTPSNQSTEATSEMAKARLFVFGTPRVENITAPGKPLRAKAVELAVFLACHPDGADTRTIGDHLEPDVRLRYADIRVHTNVSNLRHVLGRAAGQQRIGYVIKTDGRYRLDPATVHVDLWEHQDLLARAATASRPERITLLRRACDLSTMPLADGLDYDWVEPYRERARQQSTEAHLILAEDLLSSDPQAARDILDQAIHRDRYNEGLYQAAMRARHRTGDRDGIRVLLRALTTTMADLDAEPDEATFDLARTLSSDLGDDK